LGEAVRENARKDRKPGHGHGAVCASRDELGPGSSGLHLAMRERGHTLSSKESSGLKSVLVVSHSYLPSETSAALQTISLVRKLPEAGWKPIVLTVGPRWQYLPTNKDSAGPGVTVIRTALWRPLVTPERLSGMLGALKPGKASRDPDSQGRPLRGRGAAGRSQAGEEPGGGRPDATPRPRDLSPRTRPSRSHVRPRRNVVASLRAAMNTLYWSLRPSDPNFLFPFFALFRGYGVAKRNRSEAVYSIGKPFSSLVAGHFLAKLLRLPHVIEFHDPWTLSVSYRGKGLAALLERMLERCIVTSARAVIAKTRAENALLREGHPTARGDFFTVPCGFDETSLPDPETVAPPKSAVDGVCRVVHTGSLPERRSPLPFLKAVSMLATNDPDLKDRLKLIFAGRIGTFEGLSLSEWCNRLGLSATLEFRGWVDRNELLGLMAEADVFLLIPDYGGQIPAKVYEYLWFGRRILVVDEAASQSAQLVERLGRGLFARSDDLDGIAETLRSLMTEARSEAPYTAGDEELRAFSSKGRANSVAEILDSVSS